MIGWGNARETLTDPPLGRTAVRNLGHGGAGPMLLERIEINSCGALERIHLGPFSHRLNVVLGAPGSGKTATLEFIRSLMLGSDRHWHRGVSGQIIWAGDDGLWHCRRESDGTTTGRLQVDYHSRNGRLVDADRPLAARGYYDSLHHRPEFQSPVLCNIVAPRADATLESLLESCRQMGLETSTWRRDDEEIRRVTLRLEELDRELSGYLTSLESRDSLERRRQELIDQIAHAEAIEARPLPDQTRRHRLSLRLSETEDEILRLRRQESDLRRSLDAIERELSVVTLPQSELDRSLKIARVRRMQLEELDTQLVRLCRALRELRLLGDGWEQLDREAVYGLYRDDVRYYPNDHVKFTDSYYGARLDAARRQLNWLIQHYDSLMGIRRPTPSSYRPEDRIWRSSIEDHYDVDLPLLERSQLDAIMLTLKDVRDSLERVDARQVTRDQHDQQLNRYEETLSTTIRKLIDARHSLLQRIASEHGLSVRDLTEAFGDWCQCHDQPHLYQWLLSEHFPPRVEDSAVCLARRDRLQGEQRELLDELSRTANRLDDSVREAKSLRQQLQTVPVYLPVVVDQGHCQRLRNELATVHRRLRWLDSCHPLEEERRQLRRRLDSLQAGSKQTAELIRLATNRLNAMSDGRWGHLFTISDWDRACNDCNSHAYNVAQREAVKLALRMGAVDLLARRGTIVPLMIDEPCRTWDAPGMRDGIAHAVANFANGGNQVIVLTAHRGFAEHLRSLGANLMHLQPSRYYELRYRDHWDAVGRMPMDINRELDTAWREAHGVYDDPHWYRPEHQRAQRSRSYRTSYDAYDWGNGYAAPRVADETTGYQSRGTRGPASPFFLTETSPVDQAPSVDAVAAERLRGLGISTVGQLLACDPEALAYDLELADVSPRVVKRWQDEAYLVCGVPQLRSFDARVLVGCGFTDPRQLARMHPGRLLEKVEAFLATDRGRQILRTGSSYELSRITSWIAAANRSVGRSERHRGHRSNRDNGVAVRSVRTESPAVAYESSREPHVRRGEAEERARRERIRNRRERKLRERQQAEYERSERQRRANAQRPERNERVARTTEHVARSTERVARANSRVSHESTKTEHGLRFYLHLHSPIVDAPSIGPKTADRLQKFGYHTVEQFLKANADEIARQLGNKRITGETIRDWQRQATLVCRIPQLRGHDAQLLVMAGYYDPETVAASQPATLLAKIDPIAKSVDGKRILRGARRPDMEEVSDWIKWAKEHRQLRAA